MALDSSPAYSAFECGNLGLAYNETAFRHFLAIERRRADVAKRALLLVLVNLRMNHTSRVPLRSRMSAQIFKALGACVREVDFVGWHREGKVAGAVISVSGGAPADVQRLLQERVSQALGRQFARDQMPPLRVRIVQLGGKVSH